jgi:F0F1-type ATP synthase membrane subunit c/vacuolar-type H+-ATPase subunit K
VRLAALVWAFARVGVLSAIVIIDQVGGSCRHGRLGSRLLVALVLRAVLVEVFALAGLE